LILRSPAKRILRGVAAHPGCYAHASHPIPSQTPSPWTISGIGA
jgi:hypothetical protein